MSGESLSLLVIAGRQFSSPYSQWAERAAPVRSWPTPHTLWSWDSLEFKDLFSNLLLKSSQVEEPRGTGRRPAVSERFIKTSRRRRNHQISSTFSSLFFANPPIRRTLRNPSGSSEPRGGKRNHQISSTFSCRLFEKSHKVEERYPVLLLLRDWRDSSESRQRKGRLQPTFAADDPQHQT